MSPKLFAFHHAVIKRSDFSSATFRCHRLAFCVIKASLNLKPRFAALISRTEHWRPRGLWMGRTMCLFYSCQVLLSQRLVLTFASVLEKYLQYFFKKPKEKSTKNLQKASARLGFSASASPSWIFIKQMEKNSCCKTRSTRDWSGFQNCSFISGSEASLVGFISVSDRRIWEEWSRSHKHCNDMVITEKKTAAAILRTVRDTQSDKAQYSKWFCLFVFKK